MGRAPVLDETAVVSQFVDLAQAYEGYIGRWSRVVARQFLPWLEVASQASWCEVACGTGALTTTVGEWCDPKHIDASDPDALRIAFARQRFADPRTHFAIGAGTHIAAPDGTYDAVIGGLAFPAIRDTAAALREFTRVTKPGGIIAGYVWDFDGEMQLLRYFWKVANTVEFGAEASADDERFAICQPDRLRTAWQAAGLLDVVVRPIDAIARFADFDDFWMPFLSGDSPAQTLVASLDATRRDRLRDELREALPIASDRSVSLVIRAWSVKGKTG